MKKLMITLLGAAFGCAQVLFSTEVKFVDYVESDGTQYVDLDIVGRSGMRVTTRMLWVKLPGGNGGGYIGAKSGYTEFFPVYHYSYRWYLGYGITHGVNTNPSAEVVYDIVSVLRNGEQTMTVNGKTNISETVKNECNTGLNLYLFAINYSGGNYNTKARCYSLKIETNTVDGAWVTARYFRPITVDGEGALCDIVSGNIYRSATATPLVASSSPSSLFPVTRSVVNAAGEMKVFAKVDTLDGLAPCTLTAVVHDCVSGGTTTNSLGVVEDSELHEYKLSGLTPDGVYEIAIHGSWPNLGSGGLELDLFVFQVSAAVDTTKGSIYMVGPEAELDGDPLDWQVRSSGLHRLPLDGDKIIIGLCPGTYALNITNAGTRTFNGWTGAGTQDVVSETTIGAGSTLNITNTTAYSGNKSGSKASFVVDGGTLQFSGSTTFPMYNEDAMIVNGGSFLCKGTKDVTHTFEMNGTSRMYFNGGTVNLNGVGRGRVQFNAANAPSPYVVQSGGAVTLDAITIQQHSDSYYEISGGSLSVEKGILVGSEKTACATIRPRGSRFTFSTSIVGHTSSEAIHTVLPTFYDFRIRSDADPGANGVGFIDYTGSSVKGAWRAIPDGGIAIVHTNFFPLIVQSSERALTFAKDFKDGMASYRFMSTGLFDIGVPNGLEHMIRADLKQEAELADGWRGDEGICAGFVKLPRIGSPARLLKADLKLKVETQDTKTLDSIKSDLEAMGFGPVTVDETETAAYNLVVGLPKDRLAKNFADSKVLIDFTEVTGAKAMQTNTVTTNALIKAVSLDIRKPGLILMVD